MFPRALLPARRATGRGRARAFIHCVQHMRYGRADSRRPIKSTSMLDETAIDGVPAYRAPMTSGGVYDATYWCDWTDGDDGYATIPQEKLMPWLVRWFQAFQ